VANPDEIELPLASVVAGLPLDLRAKLMAAPPAGLMIRLQAEQVIGQLAFGAVKISFGELRRLAPGVFVNSGGEQDKKLVSLPLQEILPLLNPALLARRAVRKVEVAEEITGPFDGRGRGFTFTTQPLKAPVAQPRPPAPEPAPKNSITFVSPMAARQVSPPPMTPPVSLRSATPTTSTNGLAGGVHSQPISVSPLSSRPVMPGAGNDTGKGNGTNGHGHGGSNGNGMALPPGLRLGSSNANSRPDAPPLKMAPAPLSASTPSAAAPRPAAAPPTIFVALGDLCDHWPEALKNEIIRSPLAHANVALEGAAILPGLKRGRVVMNWKQLRVLAQPSSAPSPQDSLELELPLKVIAPLFLAAQKDFLRPRAKAQVSEEIPDLFFGFPQAAAPAAPVAPVVPPMAKPPETKPPETNYLVWGEKGEPPQTDDAGLRRGAVPQTDFMSRQAHPKDVVVRAVALPGVAGSVVAMQDGLRVASQAPAELNPDTLAAFLPQIYERVSQCTRELRMGALNNVSFTVGNVPWKIFRVNAVYFAVFGRAGEQLPASQLAQLAAELDRKKQQ
jgi:predicted regulator of Ras-like GTPase activity (Roadblock/LC7/MglB family)